MADTLVLQPEWLRSNTATRAQSNESNPSAVPDNGLHTPGHKGPRYSREFMLGIFDRLGNIDMPKDLQQHSAVTVPSGKKISPMASLPITEEELNPANINSTAVHRSSSGAIRGSRSRTLLLGRSGSRPATDSSVQGIASQSVSVLGTDSPSWRENSNNTDMAGGWSEPSNDDPRTAFRALSMPQGQGRSSKAAWDTKTSSGAYEQTSDDELNMDTFGKDALDALISDINDDTTDMHALTKDNADSQAIDAFWSMGSHASLRSPLTELRSESDAPVQSGVRPATPVGMSMSHPQTLPSTTMWYYKDTAGATQGPFTPMEMLEWQKAGYFGPTLLVAQGQTERFTALGTIISILGGSPFSLVPPVHPTSPATSSLNMQGHYPGDGVAASTDSMPWTFGLNSASAGAPLSSFSHPAMGSQHWSQPSFTSYAMLQEQEAALRVQQDQIRELEEQIARHREEELRVQDEHVCDESREERLGQGHVTEPSPDDDKQSELENEMERMRLENLEDEKQLMAIQETALRLESEIAHASAHLAQAQDNVHSMEDSGIGFETVSESKPGAGNTPQPAPVPVPETTAPTAPATKKKEKAKKKASASSSTTSEPFSASAVRPATSQDQQVRREAPSTAPRVVPVAPAPPTRSLLEIQQEEERVRAKEREIEREREKERAERAKQAELQLKWAAQKAPIAKTLSLSEIQEQEAKLAREKRQRDAARQAQLMSQLAQEPTLRLDPSGWNARPISGPSLTEIQSQEQSRKPGAPRNAPVPTPTPAEPPAPKTVVTVETSNFWELAGDDNMDSATKVLSKAEKKKQKKLAQAAAPPPPPAAQVQPNAQRAHNVSAAPAPNRPLTQDQFRRWASEEMSRVSTSGSVDCLTFVTILDELPSPTNVVELIKEVLGTSNDAREFSRNFIERKRSQVLLRQQAPPPAPLPTPVAAVAPRVPAQAAPPMPRPTSGGPAWPSLGGDSRSVDISSNSTNLASESTSSLASTSSAGKKGKKKAKGLRLDPSILGFSVNNTQRINAGEIQDY